MDTLASTNMALFVVSLLLGSAVVVAIVYWQARKFQAYALRVDQLAEQLALYTDASINVARSVEALVHNDRAGQVVPQASRRWLLEEARTRIENGSKPSEIAIPLGLSRDEVRLLNLAGGNRSDSLQHSH